MFDASDFIGTIVKNDVARYDTELDRLKERVRSFTKPKDDPRTISELAAELLQDPDYVTDKKVAAVAAEDAASEARLKTEKDQRVADARKPREEVTFPEPVFTGP